jgi:hypothetical protein
MITGNIYLDMLKNFAFLQHEENSIENFKQDDTLLH